MIINIKCLEEYALITYMEYQIFINYQNLYGTKKRIYALKLLGKIIKDFQNIDWEKIDKETAKKLIKSISFIFDITKKSNPISYAVFFSMQYIFWQVVVVGGILCKMKLSAKLLSNDLSLFEKEPNDLCIEDNDIIELITENEMFKDKMKQLIQKYGEGKY